MNSDLLDDAAARAVYLFLGIRIEINGRMIPITIAKRSDVAQSIVVRR